MLVVITSRDLPSSLVKHRFHLYKDGCVHSRDDQFGIEFLRYAQDDRERVTDLIECREAPAIAGHAEHEELTFSPVAV